jgi:hypothetical protein
MTSPYAAKYITAYEYFREAIFKDFNENIQYNHHVSILFKSFHEYVTKTLEDDFFLKKNSKLIVEFFMQLIEKEKNTIFYSKDNDETNFIYYQTQTKQFDLIIMLPGKKKRITKKYLSLDASKIDKNKIRLSIRANLVHFADALLVRDINRNIYRNFNFFYISIHDCFMIDFLQISKFISIANNEINKDVLKESNWKTEKFDFFSIFIFL